MRRRCGSAPRRRARCSSARPRIACSRRRGRRRRLLPAAAARGGARAAVDSPLPPGLSLARVGQTTPHDARRRRLEKGRPLACVRRG
jgi:hypothetical protein